MTTKTITRFVLALILTALASTYVEAAYRCGATQKAYFGVGSNLALQWARDFPRTSTPAVDVVVVQTRNGKDSAGNPGGHVSRIVHPIDQCHAIVADEKGQYARNICDRLVALVVPSERRSTTNDTPREKHRIARVKQRSYVQHAAYAAPDRHQIN